MFEQHPVPQQISSYQFRLVGDMTLKQFFQLAAGAVIGLILYSLPLPNFLRWPLIIISVMSGAAFAFLPIQDRPLEQWLAAFFRSIYAPTMFYWKKYDTLPQYFAAEDQVNAVATSAVSDQGLSEPESMVHDQATHALETNEKNYLSRISSMFAGKATPVQVAAQTTTPVAPVAPQATPVAPVPQQTVNVFVNRPAPPKAAPTPSPTPQVETSMVQATLQNQAAINAKQAQFSPDAAPPSPPNQKNTIVGQIMDSTGKIIEWAILEIHDDQGRPVRALKSNRVGHFLTVTPLADGNYTIKAEKDNYTFDQVNVKLSGEIVEPIAIKAQN